MLKTCQDCGTEMAMDHRRCPHCGSTMIPEENSGRIGADVEETRVSVRTADVRASVRLPDRDLTVEEQEHLNLDREDDVSR